MPVPLQGELLAETCADYKGLVARCQGEQNA